MKRFVPFVALHIVLSCALLAQPEARLQSRSLLKPWATETPIPIDQLRRVNAVIDQGIQLPLPDALQAALDSARSIFDVTGASAAMIIPGYGLWLGTSGYSNPPTHDTITSDMLFNIGSNTKTFIAATMLQLQEEGVLSLNDPLHRWLPTYRQDQYRYIDSNITIRQLLSHTSGVDDIDWPWLPVVDSLLANPDKFWLPESVLTAFVHAPDFAPGTGYSYSNTNYILAGMIIREATRSTISAQLHQRFLNPLNLTSTFFPVEESIAGIRARPWGDLNFGATNRTDLSWLPLTGQYSWIWTAGALFSRPDNMARWIANLYGGYVLEDSSLAQMLTFSPQSEGTYGLGVYRREVEGCLLVGHDGMYFGYEAEMMYCPEARLAIAIAYNCNFIGYMYPILFSVYLHHSGPHADDIALDKTYCVPGIDTVRVRARVTNPSAHPLVVTAYYETEGTVVDSSLCYDDGVHQDGAANDGVWGTMWRVPMGEAFYTIGVSTFDPVDTTRIVVDRRFTTAGPLTLDSIGYSRGFGSSYRLKPYVRNNGSSLVVRGAKVTLRCDDPWVKNIGQAVVLPDLPPGMTMSPSSVVGLAFDTAAHPSHFNVKAEITIDGWTYWTDSTRLTVTGVREEKPLPDAYALGQNYPNPFNPSTTIRYGVPARSHVTLAVFNTLGQHVATLVHREEEAGYHEVVFDASGLSSGIYMYRLTAGEFTDIKRSVLVR